MKSRVLPVTAQSLPTEPSRLSMRLALWLLESPRLGHGVGIKRPAGRLIDRLPKSA